MTRSAGRARTTCGAAIAAPVLAALLSGCGTHGDCAARIVLDGQVFRPHNELTELTLAGAKLGTGKVIGCGDADQTPVDHVAVRAFDGVDQHAAILVLGSKWGGVYVRQGLQRADWPPAIEAPSPQ